MMEYCPYCGRCVYVIQTDRFDVVEWVCSNCGTVVESENNDY